MKSSEPEQLRSAREHLSRAEAAFRSEDGLFHLEEGLALLDEIMTAGESTHRAIAHRLASTYAARIFGSIKMLVETDRGLPEPELDRFFRTILAFDHADVELPADAAPIKIELVRRLIDRYYEGYSPAEKRKAVQRLEEIAVGAKRRRSRKA
jgi:hypothetical protein